MKLFLTTVFTVVLFSAEPRILPPPSTFPLVETAEISSDYYARKTLSRTRSRLERSIGRYESRIDRYGDRLVRLYDVLGTENGETQSAIIERIIERIERRIDRLERRLARLEERFDRIIDRELLEQTEEPSEPEDGGVGEPNVDSAPLDEPAAPVPVPPVEEEMSPTPELPATQPMEPETAGEKGEDDIPAIIVTIPGIEIPTMPEQEPEQEQEQEQEQEDSEPVEENVPSSVEEDTVAPLSRGALIVMDAETGDFSQWRGADGGGSGNHSIVEDPVYAGKYAFKWTHKDGRTESASHYLPTQKDIWIGWSLWFPEDFNSDYPGGKTQGRSVTQLHGHRRCFPDKDGKYPGIHFRVANGQFFIWKQRIAEQFNGVAENMGVPLKGKWMNMLVNVKYTTGQDGFFKFWYNGELKYEYSGPTWRCDDEGPYMKVGTYAHGYSNGDYIIGDEIRIGTSRDQVVGTQ